MKRLVAVLVMLISFGIVFAINWPVDVDEILVNFGAFFEGRVWSGLLISTDDPEVSAIDSGEIVYYYSSDHSDIPSELGEFLILEHTSGLRSLYGHVKWYENNDYTVDQGEVFAVLENSDLSNGRTMYLGMYDTKSSSRVNPQMFMAQLNDTKGPVLEGMYFSNEQKTTRLTTYTVMKPGTYDVTIKVSDPGVGHLAPYKIEVIRNERTLFDISFDAIHLNLPEGQGGMELSGLDQLYNEDGYINLGKMEIPVGRYKLTTILRDANLNETKEIDYLIIEE